MHNEADDCVFAGAIMAYKSGNWSAGMSNLKQLEVFAAVVECGSFTEAANQFYMAQSTVGSHSGGWRGCRRYRCSTAPSCQFPDMRRRFPGSAPIAAEICHLGKSPQLFAGAGQADSPGKAGSR